MENIDKISLFKREEKTIARMYIEELNEKYKLGDKDFIEKVLKELVRKKEEKGISVSFNEFLEIIEHNHGKPNEYSHIDFNDEITSIKEIGDKDLMDIEVSGDNLFYVGNILTHNSAYGNSEAGLENISESIGLIATCDTVLAMIANEAQRELNQVKIKFLKNRNTGILDSIILNSDYSKMRYTDFKDAVYKEAENNGHSGWQIENTGLDFSNPKGESKIDGGLGDIFDI